MSRYSDEVEAIQRELGLDDPGAAGRMHARIARIVEAIDMLIAFRINHEDISAEAVKRELRAAFVQLIARP